MVGLTDGNTIPKVLSPCWAFVMVLTTALLAVSVRVNGPAPPEMIALNLTNWPRVTTELLGVSEVAVGSMFTVKWEYVEFLVIGTASLSVTETFTRKAPAGPVSSSMVFECNGPVNAVTAPLVELENMKL